MSRNEKHDPYNRLVTLGVLGSVVAAVCCATPLLTGLLVAVGLGAITGSVDRVLPLAILLFLVLAVYGYIKRGKNAPRRL